MDFAGWESTGMRGPKWKWTPRALFPVGATGALSGGRTEGCLNLGHAYRDYATPQEVAEEREAAEKEKRGFRLQPALDGRDRK